MTVKIMDDDDRIYFLNIVSYEQWTHEWMNEVEKIVSRVHIIWDACKIHFLNVQSEKNDLGLVEVDRSRDQTTLLVAFQILHY